MDIKEVLKKEFIGKRFKDNNDRVWGVTSQGGCSDKQSLILICDWSDDNQFVGYGIESIFFLSDIVNLKFKMLEEI